MSEKRMQKDKLVQVHWIGRFGNRLFEYAFGNCFAKQFGVMYYMPSEWEGSVLFKPSKYVQVQPNDTVRLKINQSHKDMDTFEYRKSAIDEYNRKHNDSICHINFHSASSLGNRNAFFDDLNMMYFPHCFKLYDSNFIKNELYQFSEEVKASQLYKTLERRKGTYDVIHLRRGDIAMRNYTGAHSMISKESYIKAVKKFGYDPKNFIWVSDDPKERTGHAWLDKCKNGSWRYPVGEKVMDEVFFDFFPEFLIIYFARTVFRGNSAFSWWASYLSNAQIYAPVLKNKPTDKRNKFYEMECDFVEGNHPHFMGSRGEGFHDIILS